MKKESEITSLEIPPENYLPLIMKYIKLQNKKIKQEEQKTIKTSTKKKRLKQTYTKTSTKKKTLEQKENLKTPETHRKAKVSKPHLKRSSRASYLLSAFVCSLRKTPLILIIILIPIITVSGYLMAGLLQLQSETNFYGLEVRCDGSEAETTLNKDSMCRMFYIVNQNDEPVTLSFFTTNWDPPEAFNQIDVSWDYDGSPIPSGSTYKVVITIVNSSLNVLDDFAFNIDFIAHGI